MNVLRDFPYFYFLNSAFENYQYSLILNSVILFGLVHFHLHRMRSFRRVYFVVPFLATCAT